MCYSSFSIELNALINSSKFNFPANSDSKHRAARGVR